MILIGGNIQEEIQTLVEEENQQGILVEEMILKMTQAMRMKEIQEETRTEIVGDIQEVIQEDTQETSVIMGGLQTIIMWETSLIIEIQEAILEVTMVT